MAQTLGAYPGAPVISPSPTPEKQFVSYFRDVREDDLGRSAVQHKPLNKGSHAQASLPKAFAEDKGMRPRVWVPPEVNKPHGNLTTEDIQGARSRPKSAFPHARGTHPVDPRYKISAARHSPSPDPILGVPADWALAVSHAGAGIVPDYPAGAIRHPTGAPLSASLDYALAAAVRPAPQRPASVPPPPSGSLHAADIEGASPSPLKCFQPQMAITNGITDIEGTTPGWKPPFRAHIGVRLRDPGLDVSDINIPPRRKLKPKQPGDPLVWATGTLNHESELGVDGRPTPAVQQAPGAGAGSKNGRPVSAHPALAGRTQEAAAGGAAGPPPAPPREFTGLPAFQVERPGQDGGVLAPPLPPPSEAEVAALELAGAQQGAIARVNGTIATAQRQQHLLNTHVAHTLRVKVAEEAREARDACAAAISRLCPSRATVENLWEALKAVDREASGKVTVAEFGHALRSAAVQLGPGDLGALVGGLRDGVGLIAYRDLARSLLAKSRQQPIYSSPHPEGKGLSGQAMPSRQQDNGHIPDPAHMPSRPQPSSTSHNSHISSSTPAPAQTRPPSRQGSGSATATQQQEAPSPHQAPPSTASQRPPSRQGEEEQVAAGAAAGVAPPGAVVLGPHGAKYFTWKGRTYWFGGNDTQQSLAEAAAAYKAGQDESYNVMLRYMKKGLGDGGPLDTGYKGHPSAPTQSVNGIRDMPTAASLIKSGQLTTQDLRSQLEVKHWGRAAHNRPQTALGTLGSGELRAGTAASGLHAAAQSGLSLGSALRNAVGVRGLGDSLTAARAGRPGADAPTPGVTVRGPRPRTAGRPSATVTSFTSIANRGAGPMMSVLQAAVMNEDMATVRALM